jgi:hypothetical protein
MRNKMKQLTYEEEVLVLAFIEYCQGHSMKGDCRAHMYDVYKLFKNDGRDSGTCSCLDRDTAYKVDNFITSYTFSDEVRLTERFAKLLPHLALIKEEAEKPLEEESTTNLSDGMDKFLKKEPKVKSVPVKPVRKKRTTKRKK